MKSRYLIPDAQTGKCKGYGHAYTQFPFTCMEEFLQLQRFAMNAEKGLWAEWEASEAQEGDETVYITPAGNKYHRGSCRHLRGGGMPIELRQAEQRDYEPCQTCYTGNPTIIDPNSQH